VFFGLLNKYYTRFKPSGDNGMALNSPGVEVTVIDESFYTPAESSTTPLIVIATAENKANASGTGTAQGTLATNAGKVYKVSSQRELVDFFGTPTFRRTISGSPIHGDERNEYGLQTAYSFLGSANSAYVVRAAVNLDDLTAKSEIPGSEATSGQWWLDTQSTNWGIFEWDSAPAGLAGQKFNNKVPVVITAEDTESLNGTQPASGVGRVGDYAVVTASDVIRVYYKGKDYTTVGEPVSWELLGTKEWRKFWPSFTAEIDGHSSKTSSSTFIINGVQINVPAYTTVGGMVTLINNALIQGVRAANVNGFVTLYITDATDDMVGDSTGSNALVLQDGSATVLSLFGVAAGTYYGPELSMSPHTQVPQWKSNAAISRPSGSIWVKTTDPNLGARWRVKRWNSSSKSWLEVAAPLSANAQGAIFGVNKTGGGAGIDKDTVYVQYNYTEDTGYDNTPQTASFKIFVRKIKGATSVTSDTIGAGTFSGSYTFSMRESLVNNASLSSAISITFTSAGTGADANTLRQAINNAGFVNVEATVLDGKITITHKLGGEIRIIDGDDLFTDAGFVEYNVTDATGTPNFYGSPSVSSDFDYVISNYMPMSGTSTGYVASSDAPLNDPADGQRWFNSLVDQVDIMIHNGSAWVGYKYSGSGGIATTASPVYVNGTDPMGPIVNSVRPLLQSDGTALVTGDLWIDASDLENYPVIYKYQDGLTDQIANNWVLIDKSDSTSEDGIVFGDARWDLNGESKDPATILELLSSDFVDYDAPDPDLYPRGILLFNTRRSGFNIKKYVRNHVNTSADNVRYGDESMIDYESARWVSDSGSDFGRKAQRQVVVEALKGLLNSNAEIREDEVRNFNLIATPGYPEVLQEMIALNIDRGTTAFVVGDAPFRLLPDTNSLNNWGKNVNAATDNGDVGLVSSDAYAGVFYPAGLTSDNTGNTIMVPPSYMMLRTIALNDQVSYPWFAPAGIRRGGVTNATSVGYLESKTGQFKPVALTEGQRDTLANIRVNPLTFFNGVGLVNYGQKTLSTGSSALDRINVARLVIYLRSQLSRLAKPFVFEPNDKLTRDEVRQAVESLLLELVGLRAIYDYAVVCDETNNTPARIDRNELYVDIAIEPVKAIEFIYIPLRLKNTGEIAASRAS
jgi:hypothetical protein